MKDRFFDIFQSKIDRPGSDKLLAWLESTDFFTAPASTRYHLSRPGGLVEHSVHVYERLEALKEMEFTFHPDMTSSSETLAICGLLHDICKVDCYVQEPKNQKTYDPVKVASAPKRQVKKDSLGDFIWETVMGYRFDDRLPYGHGEKSVYIISGFMRLTREEAMAIRWHMGGYDESAKGGNSTLSAAFSQFPLALLLHLADMQATYLDESEEKQIRSKKHGK